MKLADKGTRLGNYILDKIGFVAIIILHSIILDGILQVIPANGSVLLGIYFFVLYFAYHFIFEYLFGRTPGKFITKTKVLDPNGYKPTTRTLIVRNACRLIPFDNLSFLFGETGWHDKISKTQVIMVEER